MYYENKNTVLLSLQNNKNNVNKRSVINNVYEAQNFYCTDIAYDYFYFIMSIDFF